MGETLKKPYNLYRYDLNKNLEKHRLTRDCAPQVAVVNDHGVLWRCRHGGEMQPHDCYGFSSRREAMTEELRNQRLELLNLRAHITNLEKKLEKDAAKP